MSRVYIHELKERRLLENIWIKFEIRKEENERGHQKVLVFKYNRHWQETQSRLMILLLSIKLFQS